MERKRQLSRGGRSRRSEETVQVHAGNASLWDPKWLAVIALFVVSRAWLLGVFQPQYSDASFYFECAAKTVDLGIQPYAGLEIEYPPLGYYIIACPEFLNRPVRPELFTNSVIEQMRERYVRRFRLEMLLFDGAALVLWISIVRQRVGAAAWWATMVYATLPVMLPEVAYDRLDMPHLTLLIAAYAAWLRTEEAEQSSRKALPWLATAYGVLGLAISYRLIPVLMVPPLVVFECHRAAISRNWRPVVVGALAGCSGLLLPVVPMVAWVGNSTFAFLRYHGDRGIQVESVLASLQMAFAAFGADIAVYHGHGGYNVVGPGSDTLLMLSTWSLVCIVVGAAGLIVRYRNHVQRATVFRLGFGALIGAASVSKVLSPQYFIFLLPLAWLIAVESPTIAGNRGYFAGLLVLTAVLSTLLFPYLYREDVTLWGRVWVHHCALNELHWLPVTVLSIRNLAFCGWAGWVLVAMVREVTQSAKTTIINDVPENV